MASDSKQLVESTRLLLKYCQRIWFSGCYTSIPLTQDLSVIFTSNEWLSNAPDVWFFGFTDKKRYENSLTLTLCTKILSFISGYDFTRGPQMQTATLYLYSMQFKDLRSHGVQEVKVIFTAKAFVSYLLFRLDCTNIPGALRQRNPLS